MCCCIVFVLDGLFAAGQLDGWLTAAAVHNS
jgi:hypothetical protein